MLHASIIYFIKKCIIFIYMNFMQEYLKSLEMAVQTDMAFPDLHAHDVEGYREQDWTTGSVSQ